jgi:hypothetical protein
LELGDQSRVKLCVKPAAQWSARLLRDFFLLSLDLTRKALE